MGSACACGENQQMVVTSEDVHDAKNSLNGIMAAAQLMLHETENRHAQVIYNSSCDLLRQLNAMQVKAAKARDS